MTIKDIQGWDSAEVKSIVMSFTLVDAPYELEVRRFTPTDGDMLEEVWTDGHGNKRSHPTSPYAIANMQNAIPAYENMMSRKVEAFITATCLSLDRVFMKTYLMAFRHANEAPVGEVQIYDTKSQLT